MTAQISLSVHFVVLVVAALAVIDVAVAVAVSASIILVKIIAVSAGTAAQDWLVPFLSSSLKSSSCRCKIVYYNIHDFDCITIIILLFK